MIAFPELKVDMDDLVETGDKLIQEWMLEGTNGGPRWHRKASAGQLFEEWRIGGDGRVAESLGNFDTAEYRRQVQHGVDGQRQRSGRQQRVRIDCNWPAVNLIS